MKPDGGVIQVEVNDASDADQLADVRMHLHHIATAFQQGDFDIPMFIHDTIPPGESEMKALRDQIQYTLEETKKGGRVVISSTEVMTPTATSTTSTTPTQRVLISNWLLAHHAGWEMSV